MAKRKRWNAWVVYHNEPDQVFEEAIVKTARLHGGRALGSGCGGGGCDVRVEFRDEEDADEFARHIKAYYNIVRIDIALV